MTSALTHLAAGTELVEPVAGGAQLVLAALAGIALIVLLITIVKLHPFLALIFGALTVGIAAGENISDVLASFTSGFGSTAASVGILIALGAMFAKLLADSGGADEIVDTIVGHASPRALPWAMALVGAIIGLPMFFEIGLVLLMPVIYLVARRSQLSLITVGIPALAGLSAMHGFVPPHPGPVAAISLLNADLGVTLALGVLVAIPTIVVAGPLFGKLAGRWVVLEVPDRFDASETTGVDSDGGTAATTVTKTRPSFAITMFSVLLPVALMMGKALVDIFVDDKTHLLRQTFDIVGQPLMALLIAVVVGMFTLGRGASMSRDQIVKCIESSLPPVAGIILIVAAGGGFKQVLVDTGIGTLLAEWAKGANLSVVLLAWVLAVLIRLATGSATVATITASSLMLGLVEGMSTGEVSLVVLAVGAGSLFFSHVNDAGFWLVKEYFGMTVGQTIKSWSLMETALSVAGLIVVLMLGLVI
ncbi:MULTISPECIES: GntP family permease [Mycolicibacterium]|uniref:Gluconate transporter n=1 Tax=Mycolicibacterium senegalense TaxID=1796 RepID=A0A378T1B8_9MYCO|nr:MULTISPECIES: gluconate:H+ symporter [Mycolicibacterium]MCV7334890.1 gluconate transporter [Mycolicibacterium senegalense]MDR7290024.1 GntP family gluconate:H+ symporter [Mycolicibacterium senegalense]QZA26796.1 GntP family permease [Mycolicibacterium senegalense]CDP82369.1 gluconate transporter [Mycolicibacterium farcinogenes]STZ54621.1 gluconate transporter [Mycolicibacterium senegalense]